MADITRLDWEYFQRKLEKDKAKHQEEFIERIDPDVIDNYFEGNPEGGVDDKYNPKRISLARLFPATNTLLPQLYPTNPKFVPIPHGEEEETPARIATSAMDYYYEQMGALVENQKAILSAWLYGFGCTKQGWKTEFLPPDPAELKENNKKGGLLKRFTKNYNTESAVTPDYIAKEGPFLNFVNCKNMFLDCDQPYGKGQFLHERITRSLWDIKQNKLYNTGDEFYSFFNKGGKHEREQLISIYETYIWMKNDVYLLVSAEGYKKPLRYDKLPNAGEGFPYKFLTFNEQINRIYPISNMKVAQRLQRLNDYILTLQKEHIEKHKNITVWDEDAVNVNDKPRINKNEIGLNIFAKKGRPPGSVAANFGSTPIPKDMFGVQDIITQNMKEVLTITGARASGESENKTATQERIAEFGNQLRSQGMVDNIRLFLISQGKKLLADMKQFATAPMIFEITGLDLVETKSDEMGNVSQVPVTSKWVEFSTDKSPEALKDIIPKELDISIDVSNTIRRDTVAIRQQLQQTLTLVGTPDIQAMMAREGKRVKMTELVKDVLGTYETIDNPEQYFEDIPEPPPGQEQGLPQEQGVPQEQPMPPIEGDVPQIPGGAY